MARLPRPGGDAGNWGEILNDYLKTIHNDDGTLKYNVVTEQHLSSAVRTKLNASPSSSTVEDGSISTPKLADDAVTTPKLASGSVTNDKVADGIAQSKVNGLSAALDDKADASHSHTIANVTGLQAALDGKVGSDHSHAIANVTGLQAALDTKAGASHTHTVANVTGLQAALDGKAADNSVVHLSGNQTVAGVKTFSSSPIVPAPTTNTQVANKQYVDTAVAGAGGGGNVSIANLPAGSVIYAVGASTARPSSRTDLCCMWIADTAPVNALNNDVWMNGA